MVPGESGKGVGEANKMCLLTSSTGVGLAFSLDERSSFELADLLTSVANFLVFA